MARKYTRKQLKQPDEFITLSHKVWTWVTDHTARVLVMLGVAVVIIAAAWAWSYFADKRAQKATAMLGRALDILDRSVIPSASELPPSDDGVPRFKSRKAKLQATEKELAQLITKRGDGAIGRVARIMRAGVRYDLGNYAGAIEDYGVYLRVADAEDVELRKSAIEGLIYCHEALKHWAQALKAVSRLPRQGEQKFDALFHEARILARKGDTKGATERYRKIVREAGSRSLVKLAGEQLALLEHSQQS